jgi:hypothetical protein
MCVLLRRLFSTFEVLMRLFQLAKTGAKLPWNSSILLRPTKPRHTWMEVNSTALCLKSNSQISLSVLVLVLAPDLLLEHLEHLAMVGIDPVPLHPPVPVHVRLCTEGERDILPCEV